MNMYYSRIIIGTIKSIIIDIQLISSYIRVSGWHLSKTLPGQ